MLNYTNVNTTWRCGQQSADKIAEHNGQSQILKVKVLNPADCFPPSAIIANFCKASLKNK